MITTTWPNVGARPEIIAGYVYPAWSPFDSHWMNITVEVKGTLVPFWRMSETVLKNLVVKNLVVDNIWQLLAKFEGPKDKYNSLMLPVLFPSWHLPPPLRITSLLCQRCQCGLLLGVWNVARLSVWLCLYVYMKCVHQCKELSFHFATGLVGTFTRKCPSR